MYMYEVRKMGGGGGGALGQTRCERHVGRMSEARTLGLRYCTCMYKVTVTWYFTPSQPAWLYRG